MDLLCGSRQPVEEDEVFSVEPPQSPEAKFIADAWEPRERADDACALPERVERRGEQLAEDELLARRARLEQLTEQRVAHRLEQKARVHGDDAGARGHP